MKNKKAFLLATALLAVIIPGCLSPAQQKAARGDAYLEKQDWDNAITMYSQAASLDPGLKLNTKIAQAYAGKGSDAWAKKDYVLAAYYYSKAKSFDAAVDTGDLYGKALYESGKLDISRRKYTEAVTAFSAAIDAGYNNEYVRLSRAEAYAELGLFTSAIGDAGLCLDINANSAKALGIRGYGYLKTGEYRKALADLDRAIELDQTVKEAYFNRGMVLRSQGELRSATRDFQRALEMDRSYLGACIWLGRTDYALTEYSLAGEQFTRALELNPQEATVALNDRALCLAKSGNYNTALADLGALVSQHPAYWPAYYNRGALFMKMVQPQMGIDDLDLYLCLDASDKFGFRGLANNWRGYYNPYTMCCFNPGVSQLALTRCDSILTRYAAPEALPFQEGALYFSSETGDSSTAVFLWP